MSEIVGESDEKIRVDNKSKKLVTILIVMALFFNLLPIVYSILALIAVRDDFSFAIRRFKIILHLVMVIVLFVGMVIVVIRFANIAGKPLRIIKLTGIPEDVKIVLQNLRDSIGRQFDNTWVISGVYPDDLNNLKLWVQSTYGEKSLPQNWYQDQKIRNDARERYIPARLEELINKGLPINELDRLGIQEITDKQRKYITTYEGKPVEKVIVTKEGVKFKNTLILALIFASLIPIAYFTLIFVRDDEVDSDIEDQVGSPGLKWVVPILATVFYIITLITLLAGSYK